MNRLLVLLVPAALLASIVAILFVCTMNWFAAMLSWNVVAVLLWFRVIAAAQEASR